MKKVAVGLSGGVDSSVSALLLKEKGYDVIGVTLKLSSIDSCDTDMQVCCSTQDIKDARQVANFLGIEHYVIDWEDLFQREVIQPFVESYKEGLTPNPCTTCNRKIKTGRLAKYVKKILDADYFATGHYIKVEDHPEFGKVIKRGKDLKKDQSYFLSLLEREIIDYLMFPLGDFTKEEVREIAKKYNIPVSSKKESFEICFTAGKTPADYLEQNQLINQNSGDIIHISNKKLGKHKGLHHYTIGQRKGLGVAWKKPLYVIEKDISNNALIVGEEEYLYTDKVSAYDFNFLVSLEKWENIKVQGRYRQKPVDVKDFKFENGILEVSFKEPQPKFAKGQILAVYSDDCLLGGGTII